jgi:hypothetical protein
MNCHAKRLECVELAPAFEPPPPYDSASKLDALQTLRAVGMRVCRAASIVPLRLKWAPFRCMVTA